VFQVRRAEVSDAPKIVEILRSEFSSELLPYTIFGCEGVEQYVRDAIACQELGNSKWHVLCLDGSEPLGFTEIRQTIDSLVISYGYVTPSARGPGVGTSLLFHSVARARTLDQPRVELDVFHDNYSVRRGHRASGFREVCEHVWVEVPLENGIGQSAGAWYAGGLAQADRIHKSYGFSEFDLHTPSDTYRVGRLGRSLFRATDAAALWDPCVSHALATLDSRRTLLCIDRRDRLSGVMPRPAVVRARSFRMAASVDTVLQRLSSFRRF